MDGRSSEKPRKSPFTTRRITLVLIALLAVAFILFRSAELQNIRDVLQKSNPLYLLIAALFEAVCLINTSATFGTIYRLVGLTENRTRMILMSTAANFVNMVAPSGGVGGIAVFLDDANRRNYAAGRVMVAGVLYLLYEYASLLLIMAWGFIVLIQRNSLNTGELIAASLLLALALIVGLILFLGYKSSEQLGSILAALSRFANRLLKPLWRREVLRIESAYQFSGDIAEGISVVRTKGKELVWPLLLTLNNKALLLSIMACTFLALSTPFTPETLISGLSISYLFFYISPTPAGVGFVEGILPSALNSLSVPFTEAVLITLAFRFVTLWLPFAAGAVAFRLLQAPGKVAAEAKGG